MNTRFNIREESVPWFCVSPHGIAATVGARYLLAERARFVQTTRIGSGSSMRLHCCPKNWPTLSLPTLHPRRNTWIQHHSPPFLRALHRQANLKAR